MLVLQFGFDAGDPRNPHRFENHAEDRVVYTGTHDHDTARGWYESLDARQQLEVEASFAEHGVREEEPWWSLIRLAFASPARVAIVQAQDVLGLGSSARMNRPGRIGNSWQWRMQPDALTPALARRLREVTEAAGRALGAE
jgi:4-alpha-glucanotransferase